MLEAWTPEMPPGENHSDREPKQYTRMARLPAEEASEAVWYSRHTTPVNTFCLMKNDDDANLEMTPEDKNQYANHLVEIQSPR